MQDQKASRVTEALLTVSKSENFSEIQSGCGRPNTFEFMSNPTRNNSYTDMCVQDFSYPSVKVDPSDLNRTPNAPGAVVMWNTSYTTWTGARRSIAYTRFYKYRKINDKSTLSILANSDLPSNVAISTKVTVETRRKSWIGCSRKNVSNTEYGGISTYASVRRCARRGTWSWHTASLTGVSSLPIRYNIN